MLVSVGRHAGRLESDVSHGSHEPLHGIRVVAPDIDRSIEVGGWSRAAEAALDQVQESELPADDYPPMWVVSAMSQVPPTTRAIR